MGWGVFTVSPGLMFRDGIHGDGNDSLLPSCLIHLVRWQEYQTVTWKTPDLRASDISAGFQLCIQHPSLCLLMCSMVHWCCWSPGRNW